MIPSDTEAQLRLPRLTRFLLVLTTVFAFTVPTSAPASAAVYPTCTIARCDDARTARAGWAALGFPTSRGWYYWSPTGLYNFTGGRHYNRERQLPVAATYYEYDLYSRDRGARRDALRIVVNRATGATWFTPDHYRNFYRLN
ncbi:ribonuclease domain-containing protein [Nonomuraea soli]|uniref:Uncharacterized protein n=1 Tax=Nonomuraea soli TaxID=1032476 RepID=A0A7W0HQC6_9ACTN|nr:ribonuclease domain-containing protein [Nonomuraea soli]MBA2891506.1 hypothetical protein [Nonomuraea soli]